METKHDFIKNVHLFIGGPMDGDLRRGDLEGNEYLMVPEIRTSGRVHHVYEDMGYALVYRGMNQTIGTSNG